MCSLAAAVQGMDETVNNGAQAIYLKVIFSCPSHSLLYLLMTECYIRDSESMPRVSSTAT